MPQVLLDCVFKKKTLFYDIVEKMGFVPCGTPADWQRRLERKTRTLHVHITVGVCRR